MTAVDEFFQRLESFRQREALIWREGSYTFDDLIRLIAEHTTLLAEASVPEGAVVAIEGDYSPSSVAALLATVASRRIAVPLTASAKSKKAEFFETAEVQWAIQVSGDDRPTLRVAERPATHELFARLRSVGHPGLVLFTSGSTGRSKGVVHDLDLLLRKYLRPRHCYRTLAFLLFDHIGGLDTLFYSLANGSCLVTPASQTPNDVCAAIQAHGVEVLPVSPSFINLLLLSGGHEKYDFSSLRVITYGAEVMPESTLSRLSDALPLVRLLQKFGATEIGTMRSQSRASNSVWVKIGGEGFETRVVDGMLQIKAESAMLGYLNAPSPFTSDGWFVTGDRVEVDGEYYRILGRESDIINVGGQKVFPAEIEGVLMEMENVCDVAVCGKKSPFTGEMVAARIELEKPEELQTLRRRVRKYCAARLAAYKIPSSIEIATGPLCGARMKKMRKAR